MKIYHGMEISRKKLERYTNCKHCIVVDLILKHSQKGFEVGKGQLHVHYLFN